MKVHPAVQNSITVVPADVQKICNICGLPKNLSNFHRRAKSKDGRSYTCKACRSDQDSKRDPVKNRANSLAWRKRYPEKVLAWRAANYETAVRWQKQNKRLHVLKVRAWQKANPGKVNAITAKRRASILKATPRWLSVSQLKEIEQFYVESRELSWLSEGGLRVDHVVPLQGEIVCGLHVPWNLQIIPTVDNLKKGNKLLI